MTLWRRLVNLFRRAPIPCDSCGEPMSRSEYRCPDCGWQRLVPGMILQPPEGWWSRDTGETIERLKALNDENATRIARLHARS